MSDMLQDILDQYDIENNFDYCFSMYCNFLEREKRWNLCEGNNTKNNFKYRMRRCYKREIEKSKEYSKFEIWIEKRKQREQKEVELRAIKINRMNENKLEKENTSLKEQLQEKDKLLQEKDKKIKLLQQKHETLLNKYLAECDSDSD
tara:strand:+ start:83 stop:523 length:441 start_codon:yes stop_codon:yes gene_type:complete